MGIYTASAPDLLLPAQLKPGVFGDRACRLNYSQLLRFIIHEKNFHENTPQTAVRVLPSEYGFLIKDGNYRALVKHILGSETGIYVLDPSDYRSLRFPKTEMERKKLEEDKEKLDEEARQRYVGDLKSLSARRAKFAKQGICTINDLFAPDEFNTYLRELQQLPKKIEEFTEQSPNSMLPKHLQSGLEVQIPEQVERALDAVKAYVKRIHTRSYARVDDETTRVKRLLGNGL
ncbi:MAG TPA: hypothetical protein VLJ21_02760 [Candidatus Binatia bacterium]|nr:hypothetical protein [Candidatus Binatia bacterium]